MTDTLREEFHRLILEATADVWSDDDYDDPGEGVSVDEIPEEFHQQWFLPTDSEILKPIQKD